MGDETGLDDVGSVRRCQFGRTCFQGMTATSWVRVFTAWHGGCYASTWLSVCRTLQQGRNKRVLAAAGSRQRSSGKIGLNKSRDHPVVVGVAVSPNFRSVMGPGGVRTVAQPRGLQGSVSPFSLLVSAP